MTIYDIEAINTETHYFVQESNGQAEYLNWASNSYEAELYGQQLEAAIMELSGRTDQIPEEVLSAIPWGIDY